MKKLLICLLLFPFLSIAQEFNKEVVSKVSVDVCDCINTKEYTDDAKGITYLENCMMQGFATNLEYLQENGIDLMADDDRAERFGEKLGIELALKCPKALPLLMILGQEMIENGEMNSDYETQAEEDYPFIIGKIAEVEKGTFPIFKVVDINGAKHNMLWLTVVDNPALLEQALEGKKNFILEYFENELYDPRIEEYRYMKILNAVKIQE